MVTLFDKFADLDKLAEEKGKVLEIFKSIKDGILELSSLGIKLDNAKSIAAQSKALKEYEALQKKIEVGQAKLAAVLKQTEEAQARVTAANVAEAKSYGALSDNLEENIRRRQELQAQLKRTQAELKELSQFEGAANGSQEYIDKMSKLGAEEAKLKIEIEKTTRFIKNQVREMSAAEGSLDQMRGKLNQMIQAYDSLADIDKQGEFGQNALKSIQDLTAEISKQEQSQGRFFRNVGNYAGSLAPLFDKVTEEIKKLEKEQAGLQDLRQRNPIGFTVGDQNRLQQVTSQLQSLNEVQQIGFKTSGSYIQQVNTLADSFEEMAKKGQVSEDFVVGFRQELTKAKSAYTGTFRGAFDVLVGELENVRKKLKDPSLSGAQLKQLQKEEKLLTQLTENLQQGFSSTVKELRTMTEVSKQLGVEFGTDSEIFIQFTEQVGEAKDAVDDIKGVINRQASDTKFLDTAVASVNALAGAYGTAQGAMALFGNESEDVQRTMVKLQALLTIINGLQAIQNALQTEGAVIQGMIAARINIVNAAKAIEAKLFGITAVAAQAEAVAVGETAVAAEATAVAQGENAVATEAAAAANAQMTATAGTAAVAMEGEAAAATAATAATTTFRTVLLASGIGAVIAAIGAGLYFLVSKINDWVSSSSRALDLQNKLAEATKNLNDMLIDHANIYNDSDQGMKNFLQSQVDAAGKAGASQAKQFALKKTLALEEKRLAEQMVQDLGATNSAQAASLSKLQAITNKKIIVQEQYAKAVEKKDETEQEALAKVIEGYQKQYDAEKNIYDARKSARENVFNATKNVQQLDIEEQKFNADEQRKLILESTRIQVDAVTSKNNLILSNEKSTLRQRIEAMRSNLSEQKKLAEAERDDVLNDPSKSVIDKTIAVRRAAVITQKLTDETNKQIADTQEAFRQRDLQATKDMLEQKLSLEISINKSIATNTAFTLEQRLKAYSDYVGQEKKILDANYKLKLQQAGVSDGDIEKLQKDSQYKVKNKKVTDQELLRIQKEYENGVLSLGITTNKEATDILKGELDKQKALRQEHIAEIKRQLDTITNGATNRYAGDVIALNNSLISQEISLKQYNKKRLVLDQQYSADLEKTKITAIENELKIYTDAEEKEFKAKAKYDDLKQQLEKETDPAKQQQLANAIDLAKKEYDLAKEGVDAKIALEEKLADARKKINEGVTTKLIDLNTQLQERYKALGQELYNTVGAAIGGVFDRQKDELEERINIVDTLKQHEIDRINLSTESEEKKARRIKIIEARAAADKEKLEKQQRKVERDRAVFDRSFKSFQIIASGIEGVAKIKQTILELTAMSAINPAYAALIPLAAAQIPISIATTAAQVAALLATPLPKFYTGTEYSPEGYAEVGERGRELAVDRKGNLVMYDKPQIAYLEEGTKIFTNLETERILRNSKALAARITPNGIRNDVMNSTDVEKNHYYSAPLQRHDRTDEVVEELRAARLQLRELNKRSRIVIHNESGIETTSWYDQNFKH